MSHRVEGANPLWARHSAEWRDPAQIVSQWKEALSIDPSLLKCRVSGMWWDLLQDLGITIFVTREYEHLVMALNSRGGRPAISYHPVPHPSGILIDRRTRRMYLASTRNPNQLYVLKPAAGAVEPMGAGSQAPPAGPFVPVSSAFYPGCLYLHDLALLGGVLHANAVGQNAVVRLAADGQFKPVWWPKCVERAGHPDLTSNFIQLNSIAAGENLAQSFYTASSCSMDRLRPGHLNYPVDRRGVLFSGRTRTPVCTGLTRPHSARLHRGAVWLANSGYGEMGVVRNGRFEVVRKLPGWTRGLCIVKNIAFVGTSRVIPKFARYAPGLDSSESVCGVHAVSLRTGQVLGALEWPQGNQIFAIDWIRDDVSTGFIWSDGPRNHARARNFFFRYTAG